MTERSCATCRHKFTGGQSGTCQSCNNYLWLKGQHHHLWEEDLPSVAHQVAATADPIKSCSTCGHNIFAPEDPCKNCVRLFGKDENWIPREGRGLADSASTFTLSPPVDKPEPFEVSLKQRADMAATILAGMMGPGLGQHGLSRQRKAELVAASIAWVDEIEAAMKERRP